MNAFFLRLGTRQGFQLSWLLLRLLLEDLARAERKEKEIKTIKIQKNKRIRKKLNQGNVKLTCTLKITKKLQRN